MRRKLFQFGTRRPRKTWLLYFEENDQTEVSRARKMAVCFVVNKQTPGGTNYKLSNDLRHDKISVFLFIFIFDK